jgi:hypothetical protein
MRLHPPLSSPRRPGSGRAFRLIGLIGLAGLVAGPVGCASKGGSTGTSRNASGITELNLLTLPVALNLDSAPGADGIAVKIYASANASPKPVAIRSGEIEILLFDGLLAKDTTRMPEPSRSWKLTAKELRPWEVTAMVGTGYQLTLRWDSFKPTQDRVTVVARMPLGEGRFLYSSPGVISCSSER